MARKKWRSGVALALSTLMVLGMAGCGNADAGESSQSAQSEPAEEQSADKEEAEDTAQDDSAQTDNGELEVVRILGRNFGRTGENGKKVSLSNWYADGESKRWAKLEEEMAKRGIKLELELIEPDQMETTIQTMAASGELFKYDLVNIRVLDEKTRQNLVKQGQLQSISDIMETYSEGPYKEFAASEAGQFYENRLRLEDGKIYWLTDFETGTYNGEMETGNAMGFQIRQDWLDVIGREVPKTTDELFDTLMEFRAQDVNQSGKADEVILLKYNTFETDISCWFGLGPDLVFIDSTDGNTVKSPWYQEHVKEYITYMQKLYENELLQMSDSQASTYRANNQVAGLCGWASLTSSDLQVVLPEGAAFPWYIPFCAEAVEGQTPLFRGAYKYCPGSNITAVPASSDKQAAIAKIFDYLLTDESMLLQEWGIEGVSYEVVDGELTSIYDKTYENTDALGLGLWVNNSIFPRFVLNKDVADTLRGYVQEGEEAGVRDPNGKSEYVIERLNDEEHRLFHEPDALYAVPTIEESDRINEISTDLETYSQELLMKLIMGEKSLDDWDSYMSDLKELGLDELIAIQQTRCDRAFK